MVAIRDMRIKRPDKIIMGVDPGTQFCGWAIIAPDYSQCDVINVKHVDDVASRLYLIYGHLQRVASSHQASVMALERGFFPVKKQGAKWVKNPMAALILAEARGICKLLSAAHNMALHVLEPSVIKKAVTGKGNAKKDEVRRAVKRLGKFKRTPKEDAADAFALAYAVGQSREGVPF